MAIVSCPECKGKVSQAADKCIHCGHPMRVVRPYVSSAGPCPHCKSTKTVNIVEHTRKQGGWVGALAVRAAKFVAGRGTYQCTICNASWD